MSDPAKKGAERRPDGMPKGTPWGPDNPPPKSAGRPPKMRECREAIEDVRDPETVKRALAEFLRRHLEEGDNDAGKTWMAYMVGHPGEREIDLSDAPDAVVDYFADKRRN